MIVIGILLILIASYASIYVARLEFVKKVLDMLPAIIPPEFVLSSVVFVMAYIVYSFFEHKKNNKLFNGIDKINSSLNDFISEKTFNLENTDVPMIRQTTILLHSIVEEYNSFVKKTNRKIEQLDEEIVDLEDMVDLQSTLVCKINEGGKVAKANKRFLKFLSYENEVKLNMKIRNVKDIFDDELSESWLNDFLHTEKIVTLKGVKFLLRVEKVERQQTYVLSLIEITRFEEEKKALETKFLYSNKNLKSEMAINKTQEIAMIRILNYENYAGHLGSGMMEVFEDMFVDKIKNLGYDEIFRVQKDIFAVYDLHMNFEQYKKTLEQTIKIVVGGDEYIVNPKVIMGSGVNFEQSYQQILESSRTLISKEKNEIKYHLEMIQVVNKAIINNKIILGYKVIENQRNTILIYPTIKDEYDSSLIDTNLVLNIGMEFNLYLVMIKQVLINNLNLLKNYKIVINVSSEDLLSSTMLADLLSLIQREELRIVFNVDINSKYSEIYPILQQIKSYAQLGFRNIGRGYISFRDVYALKVEYLEIDDSIVKLIQTNKNWSFLLNSIKLLVSAQHTNLLSNSYKDDKVFKISQELKIYEN